MYIKDSEATIKQKAYAQRILGGDGKSKRQIALDSGYSPSVASSVRSHIETRRGFYNAMTALAVESNNLALAAMYEFKARGFQDFTNRELIAALTAIGSAWARFNDVKKDDDGDYKGKNKLRAIVLEQAGKDRFEQRTPTSKDIIDAELEREEEKRMMEIDLDF